MTNPAIFITEYIKESLKKEAQLDKRRLNEWKWAYLLNEYFEYLALFMNTKTDTKQAKGVAN